MLPPTAGDQARWEAAKDGFWIGKNKIIISDFLKNFAAARKVSDRKHRCDVNPTGPHQCQSLLLFEVLVGKCQSTEAFTKVSIFGSGLS